MNRLLALLLITLASALCQAASPRWEAVTSPVPGSAVSEVRTDLPGQDTFEVDVRGGYIYIGVSRPSTVKVFTILGQLICQETLPPGTHRLKMTAKGIYILKTDRDTRRVTI